MNAELPASANRLPPCFFWVTLGVFTDLNDVVLTNLVPGTVYTLRACAMAAGNQQSEWCAPVSHMST
jgi:hypothetical protein